MLNYFYVNIFLFIFFANTLFAQGKVNFQASHEPERPIEVTSIGNWKPGERFKPITFQCENKSNVTYTVLVRFWDLSGYVPTGSEKLPYVGIVPPGKKQIFRLQSNSIASRGADQYSTSYIQGKLTSKFKSKIEYGLPVGKNQKTEISLLKDFTVFFGADQFNHAVGYTFETFKGDTIYAARKGDVRVSGLIKEGEGGTLISNSNRTEFAIEHSDNSIGKYHVYGGLELLVKQDQLVFPGQPLAVIHSLEPNERMLHFIIYYFTRKSMINSAVYLDSEAFWKFHKPKFVVNGKGQFLKEGESYLAKYPKKLIEQEMSKKEKKEFFQ